MLITRPNQDDREASLRKYFARVKRPSKTLGLLLIAVGVLILFIAIKFFSNPGDTADESSNYSKLVMILFGLGPIAAGVIYIARLDAAYRAQFQAAQPPPPDSQVQQWLDEGFKKTIAHSQFMLSLGEAESSFQDPLVIIKPAKPITPYGSGERMESCASATIGWSSFALPTVILALMSATTTSSGTWS
jgi:hypothetical protein